MSLLVVLLIAVATAGMLAGCNQAAGLTLAHDATGEAVSYTSNYINKDGHLVEADFAVSAVDAQGDSKAIVTLKQHNPSNIAPTISFHIFGYGRGKLARFIPAAPETGPRQGLPLGSPSQIQVVDLNTGEVSLYQAPPEIDTGMYYELSLMPFSPDGTKLIVPDENNGRYYVLNLDTGQSTLIPNLKGFDIYDIIGWSAADGLIYAHTLGLAIGKQPVERFSLQGQVEELSLPGSDSNNIYNGTLSPDGKELYYETITSTQPPPTAQTKYSRVMMNVIKRYDIATGSSTVVARATAGNYFGVKAGSFALSSDGRELAYIESKPTTAGSSQKGDNTIWRIDLTSNSQPAKVIGGLNSLFRLLWCGNNLYYYYYDSLFYDPSENGGHNWYGLPATGGKPMNLEGEILGCTP
ncbi:MAG: hypothetical protein DLM69_00320 [Candidatus Chloroheliales bacterium]|nr:MAG: hypothetical protein DLM69_00320 [Chloroflexota bacterium]